MAEKKPLSERKLPTRKNYQPVAPNTPAAENAGGPGQLRRLVLNNFTVFENFDEEFSSGLNVVIGANGSGKTHFMKAGYAIARAIYEPMSVDSLEDGAVRLPSFGKTLTSVFQASLRSLSRRSLDSNNKPNDRSFSFSGSFYERGGEIVRVASANVVGGRLMMRKRNDFRGWVPETSRGSPTFIPAREILSSIVQYVGLSRRYRLSGSLLDKTQLDLAEAIMAPVLRGHEISPDLQDIYRHLYVTLGARPVLRDDGVHLDFSRYDQLHEQSSLFDDDVIAGELGESGPTLPVELSAEGHRKIAQLMLLIENGTITPESTVYWDEPETNLNPSLQALVARVLVDLAAAGVQIFAATHSFFLMKEISLEVERRRAGLSLDGSEQEEKQDVPCAYFAFSNGSNGTLVEKGANLDDIQIIASLDAAINQEDKAQRLYHHLDL